MRESTSFKVAMYRLSQLTEEEVLTIPPDQFVLLFAYKVPSNVWPVIPEEWVKQ